MVNHHGTYRWFPIISVQWTQYEAIVTCWLWLESLHITLYNVQEPSVNHLATPNNCYIVVLKDQNYALGFTSHWARFLHCIRGIPLVITRQSSLTFLFKMKQFTSLDCIFRTNRYYLHHQNLNRRLFATFFIIHAVIVFDLFGEYILNVVQQTIRPTIRKTRKLEYLWLSKMLTTCYSTTNL